MLNQAKSIVWSSEEWKQRDRELKQGQALALALEAQRHKSAFSWVTGEAQGMQHGSSELEANPNKGRSSLLLDSLLRNCSYRRGTNKIFCKIPLPMLLCLFYFIFFPDSKKNPKCSPRWKENMDNVTEQIGSTCYILVPLHLSLNFETKLDAFSRNLPPLKMSLWLMTKLQKINITKCCQERCKGYKLTLM